MKFRQSTTLVAIVAISTLVLTSCGKPSQNYAIDTKDGVYFAVPNSWHLITTKELAAEEALSTQAGAADRLARVQWQIAYSGEAKVSAARVLNFQAPNSPIVYARVRALSATEIQQVSYNYLRDLIVPLSGWEDGSATSIPVFVVKTDEELVQKGARGVHAVFNFTNYGISQTVNQIGLLSNDHRSLILFVIRCTTDCYTKNLPVIEKIVASFTDKGPNR